MVAKYVLFGSYIFSLFFFPKSNVEMEGLVRLRFCPAGGNGH